MLVSDVELSTVSELSLISVDVSPEVPPRANEKMSRANPATAIAAIIAIVLKSNVPPFLTGLIPVETEKVLLSTVVNFPSASSCANCCSSIVSNTVSV